MCISPKQIAKTERCVRLHKDAGYLIDKYMPTGRYRHALRTNLARVARLEVTPTRWPFNLHWDALKYILAEVPMTPPLILAHLALTPNEH